jgi:site-specific recombinase XerD
VAQLLYGVGPAPDGMRAMTHQRHRLSEALHRGASSEGGKDRVVMLPRASEFALRARVQRSRAQCDPLSGVQRRHHLYEQRLSRAIKTAVKRARIEKPVSAHTLRHSFATHSLQSGTDIRTVQELLGHSNVNTTMIYTHVLKIAAGTTISPLDRMRRQGDACPQDGVNTAITPTPSENQRGRYQQTW